MLGPMAKYQILITCLVHGAMPLIEVDAASDREAVDKGREQHVVPDEGGDYEVIVTSLEPTAMPARGEGWDPEGPWERPAHTEISRFSVRHEPIPDLREAVEKAAKEKADAAAEAEKRAALKAELLAEIEADKVAAASKGGAS
jgi:hypothetical protein